MGRVGADSFGSLLLEWLPAARWAREYGVRDGLRRQRPATPSRRRCGARTSPSSTKWTEAAVACTDIRGPAAGGILDLGVRLCLIALSADGAWFDDGDVSGSVPGFAAEVVDATAGCGDAFVAAFLAGLVAEPRTPGGVRPRRAPAADGGGRCPQRDAPRRDSWLAQSCRDQRSSARHGAHLNISVDARMARARRDSQCRGTRDWSLKVGTRAKRALWMQALSQMPEILPCVTGSATER